MHRARGAVSINMHEPDAVVQPLKETPRHAASYKPCVLAHVKRVVVAAHVHASCETVGVPGLLDQAHARGPVETALFEAGFFAAGVFTTTAERGTAADSACRGETTLENGAANRTPTKPTGLGVEWTGLSGEH